MTVSRRDRWLGRYAYATLDTSVGAIVAHSRDRVARLLGAATLSKGGGYPRLPSGFAFRTFGGVPLNLNGTYPIYRIA